MLEKAFINESGIINSESELLTYNATVLNFLTKVYFKLFIVFKYFKCGCLIYARFSEYQSLLLPI